MPGRNHFGSCRLSHRSLLTGASRGDLAASGGPTSRGLEDETESVGREGTRRNDVT